MQEQEEKYVCSVDIASSIHAERGIVIVLGAGVACTAIMRHMYMHVPKGVELVEYRHGTCPENLVGVFEEEYRKVLLVEEPIKFLAPPKLEIPFWRGERKDDNQPWKNRRKKR